MEHSSDPHQSHIESHPAFGGIPARIVNQIREVSKKVTGRSPGSKAGTTSSATQTSSAPQPPTSDKTNINNWTLEEKQTGYGRNLQKASDDANRAKWEHGLTDSQRSELQSRSGAAADSAAFIQSSIQKDRRGLRERTQRNRAQ